MNADELIAELDLRPHPEGGHYAERWRDTPDDGSRGAGTAILYLLRAREQSHWHRVDADEIWYFHGGAALELRRSPDAETTPETIHLGLDVAAGETPQARIPLGWWQAARSTGDWTLVSCSVSPAFTFDGFDLAEPGFEPGRKRHEPGS